MGRSLLYESGFLVELRLASRLTMILLSQSPEHWDYSCPPMTGSGSAFVGENLRGCFQVAVMKRREPVKEEEGRGRSKAGP